MPMTIERDLHMATGNGETSYTKNSRIQVKVLLSIIYFQHAQLLLLHTYRGTSCVLWQQEKVMFQIKPVLEEATRAAYSALLPQTMVVADLGCSSGPNTLRFISEVIGIIARHCKEHDRRHDYPQLQFFLNDLPGNDFNNLFLLIQQFNKSMARNHKGEAAEALPPCYISGLSGSFYTRIFPSESVHLFHSLFSVHWHSQVHMHTVHSHVTLYVFLRKSSCITCQAAGCVHAFDFLSLLKQRIVVFLCNPFLCLYTYIGIRTTEGHQK
jgi:hypothetical protein